MINNSSNGIKTQMILNELDASDDIEEIAERVVSTYEIMVDENKLLLKEREYYYEQNLKKLVKENEDLRLETLKLKD